MVLSILPCSKCFVACRLSLATFYILINKHLSHYNTEVFNVYSRVNTLLLCVLTRCYAY